MSLPAWLEPLPDAPAQRAIDRWAIDTLGIAADTLMERAGTALARLTGAIVPNGRIAVLAGKGNNGGDGRVAARALAAHGREVTLIEVTDADPVDLDRITGAAAVIDALLGTGASGPPRPAAAAAIAAINAAADGGAVIIAADVPSGVDASSGEVAAEAVRAAHTVTFHAAAPGLWLAPGKAHAGEVTIVDIGIPAVGAPVRLDTGLLTEAVLGEVPRRRADSTKFTSGHLLAVAGSARYTGAPALVARAAARAGAGYVTVSVPAAVLPVLAAKLLEEMVADRTDLDDRFDRADVVVLGPGLGREDDIPALVRRVSAGAAGPLVLDADGLNALGTDLEALSFRSGATVITPHAGELGRLLGRPSSEIAARRLACAREAATRSGAVVVLKGDDTIITDGVQTAISPGGVPALATAGTGDVLAGVIGAYLARGMEPFCAAAAGVYAHLRAGALAAAAVGAEGLIASDVIERLGLVFVDGFEPEGRS
ncbi:NAD(P)H-hydrate dehydratase [Conexibacter sp. DBS9H8]|uniref:NAD(P)H-hydrate dehydratase n=1 Tax=Conexibacter sp. DBS9H8 TaxID=2937801 RepID=UPI00200D9859|nr:NAD(P)H-hydrate dehydratase [Conexibacter sp. DBS9H8]